MSSNQKMKRNFEGLWHELWPYVLLIGPEIVFEELSKTKEC